jgi:hypothetical protein
MQFNTNWEIAMKKILLAVIAGAAISTHAQTRYHVAPQGEDSNAGTRAAPFATIQRAVAAARDGDVSEILVQPGRYHWDEPLALSPADSGLAIRAAEAGSKARISGGQRIVGWQESEDGLWRASLPEGLKDGIDQLFVNGRRAVRAREPDQFYFYLTGVREDVIEPGDGTGARRATQTLALRPDEFAILKDMPEEDLRRTAIVAYHKWDITRRKIKARVDGEQAVIVGDSGMKPWNRLLPGLRYRLENYRAALDEPGEWFLDRAGILLYHPRPDEDIDSAELVAPVIDRFITIAGDPDSGAQVKDIVISGLSFQHARAADDIDQFGPIQAAADIAAVITVEHARDISIQDCEIAHIGGYAVWFRRGSRDCALRRNYIHDLGAGGVRIGEMAPPAGDPDATAAIVVDNNIIRDGGNIYAPAVGVWIGHSPDNRISHNEIADFFYTGISVGWRWGYAESVAKRNTIEFNRVRHIGQRVLSDMGGIYTLGPSQGTVVRNNIFHDIYAYGYGGWGLYTDEGSTGILFENNLVYNVKTGGFHQHYGRENIVRNNILAFSELYQLQATRVEEHLSFTLENNIVYWDRGALLHGPWERVRHHSRSNCYWRAGSEAVDFLGHSLEEWQTAGHELGSQVVDPRFADPAGRDFSLPPDSPALALGFAPFDVDKAGVYGSDDWRRMADENTAEPPVMPPARPAGIPYAP